MNEKPLFRIPSVVPNPGLLQRVLLAVYRKQEKARLWRVRVFAVSAALSIAALFPVVDSLVVAFKASNFGVYISLIFSDGGLAPAFWKEITASLVESLPVIAVLGTLALLAILLWSVRSMVRFMRNSSSAGPVMA